MSDTVVDSSVVAKWILPEADSPQADRLVVEVAGKGERLIVLDLALVEVTNAIWKRYHRGLVTLDEAGDGGDFADHQVVEHFLFEGPALGPGDGMPLAGDAVVIGHQGPLVSSDGPGPLANTQKANSGTFLRWMAAATSDRSLPSAC